VKDLSERATGQNERVEAKLRRKYPPLFSPESYHLKPCTVKDKVGNLMMWYIPGCLTVFRSVSEIVHVPPRPEVTAAEQKQIWQDLEVLQKSLQIKKNGNSWRVAPTHFRVEEGWLKPGSASMSPAWFQQAHEVCILTAQCDPLF